MFQSWEPCLESDLIIYVVGVEIAIFQSHLSHDGYRLPFTGPNNYFNAHLNSFSSVKVKASAC